MNNVKTPPFYWGTATAAFQIEGSPLADGAVPSDWYHLSHMQDKILGGDTADIACDHYRRWREDIDLMQQLEVNAYRFSFAWPRIFRDKHQINEKGLDFYDRLLDGLCERGITPFVTLFHWDLPEWVDREGGWLWGDVGPHFLEYAQTAFDRFGDRVKHWVTFNEPVIYYHSYVTGWHWPLRNGDYPALLTCWDQILNAHCAATGLLHAGNSKGKIGLVHSYHLLEPVSSSEADLAATVRADGFRNRWFLDRLFTGRYPQDMLERFEGIAPKACYEAVPVEREPDFLGVNYYAIGKIQDDPSVPVLGFSEPRCEFELQPIIPSQPEGLYEMMRRVHAQYGPKEIYLTENGYLEHESEVCESPLQDVRRQQFLSDHLVQVQRCREDNIPLKGYFHWSLLDNFEWRWGLNRRFGLVHVDRKDQARRVKDSGWLYRDLIRQYR